MVVILNSDPLTELQISQENKMAVDGLVLIEEHFAGTDLCSKL